MKLKLPRFWLQTLGMLAIAGYILFHCQPLRTITWRCWSTRQELLDQQFSGPGRSLPSAVRGCARSCRRLRSHGSWSLATRYGVTDPARSSFRERKAVAGNRKPGRPSNSSIQRNWLYGWHEVEDRLELKRHARHTTKKTIAKKAVAEGGGREGASPQKGSGRKPSRRKPSRRRQSRRRSCQEGR